MTVQAWWLVLVAVAVVAGVWVTARPAARQGGRAPDQIGGGDDDGDEYVHGEGADAGACFGGGDAGGCDGGGGGD